MMTRATLTLATLGLLLASCDQELLLDSADTAAPAAARVQGDAPELGQAAEEAPARPAIEVVDVVASLTITTDRGNDGIVDEVRTTWFDTRGDRRFQEDDRDGDGVLDQVTAWSYVYEGRRRVRTETDEGDDGVIDSVETRTYDDAGHLVRVVTDDGLDGTPDRIETHEYDASGRRVRMAIDSPVGGVLETDQRWSWRGDQRMERTMYRRGERVGTRYAHQYLPDGRVGAIEIDREGDGTPDNRVTRSYDDEGRLARAATDVGADGTVDSITSYGYDEHGRLVTLDIDADADGRPDTVTVREYEGYDNLHRQSGCR